MAIDELAFLWDVPKYYVLRGRIRHTHDRGVDKQRQSRHLRRNSRQKSTNSARGRDVLHTKKPRRMRCVGGGGTFDRRGTGNTERETKKAEQKKISQREDLAFFSSLLYLLPMCCGRSGSSFCLCCCCNCFSSVVAACTHCRPPTLMHACRCRCRCWLVFQSRLD